PIVGTSATLLRPSLSASTARRSVAISRMICTAARPPILAASIRHPMRPPCRADRKIATLMTKPAPHRIIFANEKGGTGKSTCAVHFAVALASMGWRVAGIDLDPRQRTFHRYLENRENTARRRGIELPTPRFEVFEGSRSEERRVGKE